MEATPSLIEETQFEESGFRQREAVISVEFVAYLVLIVLALVLRIAQLDAVPLSQAESREALAAWRVVQPDVTGSNIVPESPLLFLAHSLSFTMLGGSEFTVRIWTVLASLSLILTPLLFRDLLGRGRAFILSVLFTFSPVLLLTSRSDSAVVWTLLLGILALWTTWRYYTTAKLHFGVLAIVMIVAAVLLSDPTGFIFVMILIGAAVFALWITPKTVNNETENASAIGVSVARERLQTIPWQSGLLIAVFTVALVGSLFLLYPAGLSAVSGLLSAGARGLTTPLPDTPVFFPLLVIVFYEPVLILMGLVAIGWLVRRDEVTFVERFLIGWLLFGVLATTLYAGTGPEHALWLVLPLAGLMSSLVAGLLARTEHPLWWDVPSWSKWLVALVTVALFGMFAIHIQSFGRSLLSSPPGAIELLNTNAASVVWVIISLLFMVIGFFLGSSVWGLGTTVQGAALGLLAFGLVTSLGSGWRASVVTAESPVELWNRQPVSDNVLVLRQTLYEVADRQTNGLPQIPVAALVPEDGAVAWVLRDFVNTRFITDVNDARTEEIALLPETNEPPNLGGSYVGSKFVVSASWNPQSTGVVDWLSWWLQRKTRVPAAPTDSIILWLRQDIYNGVPYQPVVGS